MNKALFLLDAFTNGVKVQNVVIGRVVVTVAPHLCDISFLPNTVLSFHSVLESRKEEKEHPI